MLLVTCTSSKYITRSLHNGNAEQLPTMAMTTTTTTIVREGQRRGVRFAEMATMYLVPRWEDETKAEMWWLPGDQAMFKHEAKELARDQRRRTNLPDFVNQAYDWAREVSSETKGEASLVQRLRGLPVHRVRGREARCNPSRVLLFGCLFLTRLWFRLPLFTISESFHLELWQSWTSGTRAICFKSSKLPY